MQLSLLLSLIGVFILGFIIGRITKRNSRSDASQFEYLNTIHSLNDSFTKDPAINDNLLALIRSGKKLEAIKLYRSHFRCGLKEAKDAIDAMS